MSLLLIACQGFGLMSVSSPVARASSLSSVPMIITAEIIDPLEVNVMQNIELTSSGKLGLTGVDTIRQIDYQIQLRWNEEWGFAVLLPPAVITHNGVHIPITFTPPVHAQTEPYFPQSATYQLKVTNTAQLLENAGLIQGSALITVYGKF